MWSQPFEICGAVFLGLALLGCVYSVFAGSKVGAFHGRARVEPTPAPAVTLLKPLHGWEPGLEQALESFLAQDYAGPVQIIFGVQDGADSARAVIEALSRARPDRDIALVVDATGHGANHKISNLINMAARARHDVLVLSDSDIAAGPDYLGLIVAALAESGVGVVTCPYYGTATAGVWSRLAAMGISYQFLPSVAVGVSLGLAHPCMGSTIALKRDVLEEIGGFQAFADVLADDYEIGRAIRAAGYLSVTAPVLVAHGCAEQRLGELIAHELRWARTIRGVDPAGFFGSGITHALPLALLGTALLWRSPLAWLILAIAALSRLWLMQRVDDAAQNKCGVWWLAPARDILSFGIFVGSFFGRAVEWRGTRFRVDSRGGLFRI